MMKKINIEGVNYTLNEKLENFSIKSKPSSNVAFYGVSHDAGNPQLFVQFKNRSSYIYSGLNEETLRELDGCESIGKFISSKIVKKFTGEKMEGSLVVEVLNNFKPEDHFETDIDGQIANRINRKCQNSESVQMSVNEKGVLEEPQF